MTVFDRERFLRLPVLKLTDYCEELRSGNYRGITVEAISPLIENIKVLDEAHAMYLILFGIQVRFPEISDIAVEFLNRDQPWHGPQYEIVRSLQFAHDIRTDHIDRIRIGPMNTFRGASLPNVFPQLLDDLRKAIASRANIEDPSEDVRKTKGVDSGQ